MDQYYVVVCFEEGGNVSRPGLVGVGRIEGRKRLGGQVVRFRVEVTFDIGTVKYLEFIEHRGEYATHNCHMVSSITGPDWPFSARLP